MVFLLYLFLLRCECEKDFARGSALKHSNASSKPGRTTPKGETRVRKEGSHMRSESPSTLAFKLKVIRKSFIYIIINYILK